MPTNDFRTRYFQVKGTEEDQNKTAFNSPFGTYKFNWMALRLKNVPATISKMIDKFRFGLKDVFALSYVVDIVLSSTFQKYLFDLKQVSKRLSLITLNTNPEKCHFCCEK